MTKVITISDESYDELKRLKKELSFSKIIIELARERKKENMMSFAGMLTNEEAEKMKKNLSEMRKTASRRFK